MPGRGRPRPGTGAEHTWLPTSSGGSSPPSALLVLVSIITFSIFYLVPRWAGATPETLATRYVGRTATAETVKLTAERLGFYDPFYVQYRHWAKTVVVGGEFDMGADDGAAARRPCLGYSFITRQPVWPELLDRAPVTFSLAIGAAIIWVVSGVSIGVLSALRRGSIFDRGAMTIALAGVSMPIFWTGLMGLTFFSYKWHIFPPGGTLHAVLHQPGGVGLRPDAALDHAGPAVLRAVRPAHPRRHARDHERGLRPHRPGEGPAGARGSWSSTACAARSPRILTIFGLDFGLLIGGAVLTEKVFSLNGLGQVRHRRHRQQRPAARCSGVTLLAALFVIIANLVVDLLYAVVDPRVRAK